MEGMTEAAYNPTKTTFDRGKIALMELHEQLGALGDRLTPVRHHPHPENPSVVNPDAKSPFEDFVQDIERAGRRVRGLIEDLDL